MLHMRYTGHYYTNTTRLLTVYIIKNNLMLQMRDIARKL
jgi:hypothetical protein